MHNLIYDLACLGNIICSSFQEIRLRKAVMSRVSIFLNTGNVLHLYQNATETYSECSMPGTALDSRDKGWNTEAYTERIKRQRLRGWTTTGRQRGQKGTILGGPGPLQHPTESLLNGEVLKYYLIPWKLPQFHNRLCH